MDKLLDKVSPYNLLNNLVPGGIFCYLLLYINGIDLRFGGVVDNLFVYYFLGLVISRLGSLFVEPIAKKVGLVNYANYNDYLMASEIDGKISELLEMNNLYRTMVASGLLIIIISIYLFSAQQIWILFDITPYLVAIILLFLFLFSYKKQTAYIKKRVGYVVQNKRKGNTE